MVDADSDLITYEELAERWPATFGPDGIVPREEFDEIAATCYSMEIFQGGLRIGFAFAKEEYDKAFERGADLAGRLAPDMCATSTCTIGEDYIVYAQLEWDG